MTSTTATRRLAELNARVEDPDLWNDAEEAQKIMRERTELEDRLGSLGMLDRELDDAVTLVELGEMEDDAATEKEGVDGDEGAAAGKRASVRSRRCSPARPTATTPISKFIRAPAAPRARTGRACCSACTRAGPSARSSRSR